MKANYRIGLALLAGAALGALVVQGLHSQAKPPVYSIGEIDIVNKDAYTKEYAPLILAAIKAGGGRTLAAGQVTALDGTPPKGRVVITYWEDIEKLNAYRASAAFADARKIGEKYAKFRTFAVEGVPQ
jgi:uncharacterized protein (DUF1330 family)